MIVKVSNRFVRDVIEISDDGPWPGDGGDGTQATREVYKTLPPSGGRQRLIGLLSKRTPADHSHPNEPIFEVVNADDLPAIFLPGSFGSFYARPPAPEVKAELAIEPEPVPEVKP